MSLSIIIPSAILILLIIVVIETTIIVCRQKRNITFQQSENDISKEFRDRLESNLSQSRQNDEKLVEMVKKNAENINSNLCEISSQLKFLSTEFNKQVEKINPSYTTERVENFCGQIMNRVISLEEKIYDLKRINEQLVADCRKQKNVPSSISSEEKTQTVKSFHEERPYFCKGKLIADLVKSLDPGDNASPAETKKFEMQVKIINMVDEVLKISDIQAPQNFTLTLNTHWVNELGINYGQVARADVMLLARLFNLDADTILYHMTDALFSREAKGMSIFWDSAWKRGDDYLLSTSVEDGSNGFAYNDNASTIGKDFWKKIPFDEIQSPDYVPCFARIFSYCEQKNYFCRGDKMDSFTNIIKNLF